MQTFRKVPPVLWSAPVSDIIPRRPSSIRHFSSPSLKILDASRFLRGRQLSIQIPSSITRPRHTLCFRSVFFQ